MSENPKYLTVVFEIHDSNRFKPLMDQIAAMFVVEPDHESGATVTGMSQGDLMAELERLEESTDE